MVFKPELSWEFLSKEEIAERSIKAVRNHVTHLKEVSPYYREVLADVEPAFISSEEAIAQLPFTDKSTLIDNIQTFKTVPDGQVTETIVTGGSTGHSIIFSMTRNDLDRLAFNEALSFNAAGVTPDDRAQILINLDHLFIAGMACYRGLITLGVNTARIGIQEFNLHKYYLEQLKPTVIVGVPSYLKRFAQQLTENDFDTKASSVKKIFCIGENLREESLEMNSMGKALQEMFAAQVYSMYGITELSVAYSECTARNGNHAHPELVYTEVVNEQGYPVPDGTPGELVGTPLGVEGIPLLRYRTGDFTFKVPGTCRCGRNSNRIGPIKVSKSQMINLNGIKISPHTITGALDELDFVEDYIIILEGSGSFSDRIILHVAAQPTMIEHISVHLREKVKVGIPILISNTATINSYRGDGKNGIKIIDKRKKQNTPLSP